MTSLRRVLLVSILTGFGCVLVISGTVVYLVARSSLRTQQDRALISRAGMFAALVIDEPLNPQDPGDPGGLVFDYKGELREEDAGVLVRISDEDGRVLARSPGWPGDVPLPAAGAPGDPAMLADITLEGGRPARLAVITHLAAREAEAPGQAPAASQRRVSVAVIEPREAVARAGAALLVALVAGGVLAAAGAAGAVLLGVRRGMRPVQRLCTQLQGIDARAPASRLAPGDYPRELRPIVAALDELLARVGQTLERERRFTDAAAHELRTPIAELGALTDVAERFPDPQRLLRTVSESRAVVQEMETLLELLLDMARGARAFEHQPAEQVPLLPLARALLQARKQDLQTRNISLELEGNELATWVAPAGAVQVILRNVLDNAAEYTPEGGTIRVVAQEHEGGTTLEVENGPVPLQPDAIDRLFEPFWRADESRSGRGHRGLGLAIVAALADSLGIQRRAALSPERRLRMIFSS